jgi:hypothetical protein
MPGISFGTKGQYIEQTLHTLSIRTTGNKQPLIDKRQAIGSQPDDGTSSSPAVGLGIAVGILFLMAIALMLLKYLGACSRPKPEVRKQQRNTEGITYNEWIQLTAEQSRHSATPVTRLETCPQTRPVTHPRPSPRPRSSQEQDPPPRYDQVVKMPPQIYQSRRTTVEAQRWDGILDIR